MRSKIKILFIIIAYVLNLAHELQPHEHHLTECCEDIFSSVISHVHTSQTSHHSHDNESDDYEDEQKDNSLPLPFPHSHSLHSSGYFQIKNLQTSIIFSEFYEIFDTKFCFQPPELAYIEIIQRDKKNFYQNCIGSTLCLRAPPVLS